MFGVGLQQVVTIVFFVHVVVFHMTMVRDQRLDSTLKSKATGLLYAIYACLALISVSPVGITNGYIPLANIHDFQVRKIFRMFEYWNGLKRTIPNHEVYIYILDSLPMLLALILFNAVHPSRIISAKKSTTSTERGPRFDGNKYTSI